MAGPPRPPRTRASGGRSFILLGVLLALVVGAIVIFVVSTYAPSTTQMQTVVVAKKDLPAGAILVAETTDATNPVDVLISDAFEAKQVNADFVTPNAMIYTTPEHLNVALNKKVTVGTFYAGDILHTKDSRLVDLGSGTSGSLALINPAALKAGDLITEVKLQAKAALVPGDMVDVIVTECNLPGSKDASHCETQTTLENVPVYAVRDDVVFLVLDHQKSLQLKFLSETGKLELAVRKQGDTSTVTTDPVTNAVIVTDFHY